MTSVKELERELPAEQPDSSLQMEFWRETLSESQQAYYSRAEKEYLNIMSKVSDFISKENGSVVERGSEILVLQKGPSGVSVLNNLVSPAPQSLGLNQKSRVIALQSQSTQPIPALQAVSSQQLVMQSGSVPTGARVTRTASSSGTFQSPQGTIQLVMDPRLGLIVGTTISNQQNPVTQIMQPTHVPQTVASQLPTTVPPPVQSVQAAQPVKSMPSAKGRPPAAARPNIIKTSTVTTSSSQTNVPASSTTTSPSTSTVPALKATSQKPLKNKSVTPASGVQTTIPTSSNIPTSNNIPTSTNKPTESSSIGGLSAGSSISKPLQDEGKSSSSGPDTRELHFNKLSGKTFPSLVVVARPHLRVKEMTQAKINQERAGLDSKVKCVLMYNASKFTEWLIQQGLVRNDQFCSKHSSPDGPIKLKLGMYSDVSKFPYSGGYVWVSECCPQRFVSVFSGSIFEGAPHNPTVLLKLMYHWCCQTNVQNVVQWVKVDNLYVKNFFNHMRSICIAAVHEKHEKLGGPSKKVEVGVISLGTTSAQIPNMRQVKVEVLGVMDTENKMVRLRAVEPLQDGERNYKRRFVKILEPLVHWVHPESTILTDFTVDRGTLVNMGFHQVLQSTIPDPPSTASKMSNQNIMEYLRRIVPRMFQNTLSLLSRQIIQQYLDELVWRERWGPVPSQAFDSLVSHLADQTKLDTGESLITKLGKISGNPFRCWNYQNWKNDGNDTSLPAIIRPPVPPLTPFACSKSRAASAAKALSEDNDVNPTIAIKKSFEFELDEEAKKQVGKAVELMEQGTSLRESIKICKVPRSVLLDKAKDALKTKTSGPAVFSDEEEEDIKDHLMTLFDWGYPFGRWDIRLVVKQYLDVCGRTELRFKDNFPADSWVERFLTRHPIIRHRLCRNIPSRGNHVESEGVRQYILNLSSVIQTVAPENILNCMEIGLTGDPLKSMTLELRDLRYPVGKRKVKSSAAVMLSCTALGRVLPSFVIFEGKTQKITKGNFAGEYYGSKTGWFDETAFEYWVESVLLPWAEGLQGKKVVIGDSLAQLFTLKTLAICLDKNISFVAMPCNVSGVLSPLDVVLCDKLRTQWRAQTRTWALSHSDKYITTEDFPSHIHELLTTSIGPDMPELLRTAFKVIGLYPFNSKNTMQALENGGVSLTDCNPAQTDSKRRKRIYIGTEDVVKKKPAPLPVEELVPNKGDAPSRTSVGTAHKYSRDCVVLDSYFFGTKPPSKEILLNEFKTENLGTKCPLCHEIVSDNLTLMKHLLVGHSENEQSLEMLSSCLLCRYCSKTFTTSEELDTHIMEAHKGFLSSKNDCIICAENMESKENLIKHMQKTHTKLELPYVCTICFYRSSEHHMVVDHFYAVHAGGEKIQCPYCLKCVAVSNMGKRMAANTFFFMHHVQKHRASNSSRKCEKCSLWFVHKGLLSEHQVKDHLSCKDDSSVVPYVASEDCVKVPLQRKFYGPASKDSSMNIMRVYRSSLKHITFTNEVTRLNCLECNETMDNHFREMLSCQQCQYSTCCDVSMTKHIKVFHSKGRPESIELPLDMLLPEEMHCMCSFSSRDGNALADHLVKCEFVRRIAYSSPAAAKAAGVACNRLPQAADQEFLGSLLELTKCKRRAGSKGNKKRATKDPPSLFNSLANTRTSPALGRIESVETATGIEPSSQESTSCSASLPQKRTAEEAELQSTDGDTLRPNQKGKYEEIPLMNELKLESVEQLESSGSIGCNSDVTQATTSSAKLRKSVPECAEVEGETSMGSKEISCGKMSEDAASGMGSNLNLKVLEDVTSISGMQVSSYASSTAEPQEKLTRE